jgi:hypothetical protein
MLMVVVLKLLFGKDQFIYYIIRLLTLFLDFNVLPFMYIILAEEPFKKAFLSRDYLQLGKLMLQF